MRSILTLSLVVPLLFSTGAGATTLHTPPALASFAGTLLLCQVRNVGTSPRAIVVDALDFAGTAVETNDGVVAPGAVHTLGAGHVGAASCRVTFSGSATNVRANALYVDFVVDPQAPDAMIDIPAE